MSSATSVDTSPPAALIDTGEARAPEPVQQDDWLTKEDAARVIAVSAKTIQRFVADGALPAYRAGRSLRIRRSDLNEFMVRSGPARIEAADLGVASGVFPAAEPSVARYSPEDRSALLELGRQARDAGIRKIFKNRVTDPAYSTEFIEALSGVWQGGTVRMMSNSLRFLLGPQPDRALYVPMWTALKKDVVFELLLLDPFSDAARRRAGVEEREVFSELDRRYFQTHLFRDIISVVERLAEPDLDFIRDEKLRERLADRDQVRVRFSRADPTTHLILTDQLCLVENYHSGGDEEIKGRLDEMGILNVDCFGGFITALSYEATALTGRLLASHFEQSWKQAGEETTVESIVERHRHESSSA
jgi:excisionase family DNA binding protein